MNLKTSIIEVTSENITDHPQVICYINPKHEYYGLKLDWIAEQYKNGLKIKLLYLEGQKRAVGFLEYIPGEYCWRAVDAKGYMFIHCLWTYGKKNQHQGLGGLLIKEAEKDAEGMQGVAVLTSDKSFMANKEIFIKNDYQIVAESGKDQLMVKKFIDAPSPSINDWQSELEKISRFTILYSKQCPWVARFIEEVKPILEREGLDPNIIEITSPDQAQNAPTLYSVFNLIYNGKILADRYISTTRFENIIKKEILH